MILRLFSLLFWMILLTEGIPVGKIILSGDGISRGIPFLCWQIIIKYGLI